MLRSLYPLLCVALVAGVAGVARQCAPVTAQEARTAVVAPARTPREAWAVDFLGRLGNAQPTPETIAIVVEWTLAEDSGGGAFERFNPLNTTQPSSAETVTINEDGVKGYESRAAGLDATVHTITNGYYDAVVRALQSNDPEGAKQALWASPWAGSHYNGGVDWPAYQLEETQARVSSCPLDPCWQSGSGYSAGHPGIDLGANVGQPVYATQDGQASLSTTWPCGNGLMITQGDRQTLMCHLSAFAVGEGAAVRAGDLVAYAGSTGESTGPHVHMEIRVGGVNVDPSEVLR